MSAGQRAKGSDENGKGKGFRVRMKREKHRNRMERIKSIEGPETGSRVLGKEYRTHGCQESQDVWQPCR